jgi:hypothetical protein
MHYKGQQALIPGKANIKHGPSLENTDFDKLNLKI